MSTTPLTDAAVIDGATWLAPARELYLCSQRLELACAAKDALIAKLREDKARLDECLRHGSGLAIIYADGKGIPYVCQTRDQIDAARKGATP